MVGTIDSRYPPGHIRGRSPSTSTAPLALAATTVLGLAIGGPAAAAEGEAHLDATTIIATPETGVELGWGWDTFDSKPVPSVCIEFAEAAEPAQTVTVSLHEVSDSYEVMERLGVSAAASVTTIGFEVSGKAAFAKDLDVTNFASTFLLTAEVHNGVRFAAPVPPTTNAGGPRLSPTGGNQPQPAAEPEHFAVRLTPAGLAVARADLEAFERQCGNAFVSAAYRGARLHAAVTINTRTQREKETVSAAMSGSGWGVKVDAAFSTAEGSALETMERDIAFFQMGGRDEEVPTDQVEILGRLRSLAQQASEAPKDFHIAVTPYEELANWPRGEIRGVETELDQLAAYWGAYNTLYDELDRVLANPERYGAAVSRRNSEDGGAEYAPSLDTSDADPPACPGPTPGLIPLTGEQIRALETVQDEVLEALRRLREDARTCTAAEETCTFDEDAYRSWYAFRVQLPLPVCFEPTVENLIDVHLREPAKSRCALGVETVGCLFNREIRIWGGRVGMYALDLGENGAKTFRKASSARAFAIKDETGQPGVIWYHAGDHDNVMDALCEALPDRPACETE